MTDHNREDREDDGRIRIWVNSGANMSRGKYAAAAVHAALTAAGVHPGVPVIVLGGQRDHIEKMRTVIHDAGRTEIEPGTATAGTDYVFEQRVIDGEWWTVHHPETQGEQTDAAENNEREENP